MKLKLFVFLGLLCSFNAVGQWSQLKGPAGGEIHHVRRDPTNSKLYALVSYKLYVSDFGDSWTEIKAPVDIQIYDVVPNGNEITILQSDATRFSADGGLTWTVKYAKPSTQQTLMGRLFKSASSNTFFATFNEGVFVSTDGGTTFKKIYTNSGTILDVKQNSVGDLFLAHGSQGILKLPYPSNPTNISSWSEANWVVVHAPMHSPLGEYYRIVISSTDKIFVTIPDEAANLLRFKSSTDGGSTWTELSMTGNTASNWPVGLVLTPTPAGKLLMFDNEGKHVWEYTEGAATPWLIKPWPTAARSAQYVHSVVYRNTDLFVGAAIDGIFRSSNGGNSWSQSSNGIYEGTGTQVAVLDNGKILIVQGESPPGFYFSADNGNTWNFKDTGFGIKRLIKLPDNTLLINDASNITHRSVDGGDTWLDNPSPDALHQFTVVAANDIYGFGNDGLVRETIDKGQNWISITTTGLPASYIPWSAVRDSDGYFYFLISDHSYNNKELWRLNSNTTPWNAVKLTTSPIGPMWSPFSFTAFVGSNKLYIHDGGSNNYVSKDHGVTWSKLTINGKLLPFNGGIAAATPGNIALSQDDGKTVRNMALPTSTALIIQLGSNAVGGFYIASASNSPALKFTGNFALPADQLEPYIEYGWHTVPGGPYGTDQCEIAVGTSGKLFALANSAVHLFDASTQTWSRHFSDYNAFGLMVDGSDAYTIIRGKILKSTNGGTFAEVGTVNPDGDLLARKIIKTPSGTIIVSSQSGIYRSSDQAATFTKVLNDNCISIAASGNGTLVAIVGGSTNTLKRSVDDGVSWTTLSTGLPADQPPGDIQKAEGNTLVLITYSQLHRSTNNGDSWTSITTGLPVFFYNDFVNFFNVSPAGHYYFNFQGIYYASTDNGATWSKRTTDDSRPYNLVWNGTTAYSASAKSQIVRSVDNAATFQAMSNKGIMMLRLIDLEVIDGRIVIGDKASMDVPFSDDGGATFTYPSASISYPNGLLKAPNNNLYTYGYGIKKSIDKGTTWSDVPSPSGLIRYLVTADGTTFYAAVNDGPTYKLYITNDLTTWVLLPAAGLPDNLNVSAMATDGLTVYFVDFGSNQGLWQVTFGVASRVPGVDNISQVLHRNGKVYAVTNNKNTIYEKGVSGWTRKTVTSGSRLDITPRNQFYLSHGWDVFVSRDQGITWQDISEGIPDGTLVSSISVDEYTGFAYAATFGGGVMKSDKIVFPDDKTVPVKTVLSPADDATNVLLDSKLVVTFDEATFPVAGKKVRIFKPGVVNAALELDVTTAARNGKTFTFTLPSDLAYSTDYYIVIDNGGFKDLFGNLFAGITDQTSWTFTTIEAPDTQVPVISVPAVGNLEVGTGNKVIQLNVTDNKTIAVASAKFFYGSVTSKDALQSLAVNSAGTGGSVAFTATISETAYNGVGISFYFEVADAVGNKTRYPATADTYEYSYLTYPSSQNPALPALPAGGKKGNYKMISLPFEFGDKKVSTLFSALGEPKRDVWRLLTHAGGATTNWTEYGDGDFSTIERGTGYWINVKAPIEIKVPSASVPANRPGSWFVMELRPGWNQIGNPYTVPISWEEIRTANTSVGKVKIFNPLTLTYSNGDVLDKFGAGFVFVSGSANAPLTIRFQGFTTGRKPDPGFGTDLGNDKWQLPITLTQGTSTTEFSGIGMHPEADVEMDRFDDVNPPAFVKLMEMNFDHPLGPVKRLAMDVQPTKEFHQWNFTINADSEEQVQLQWDNTQLGDNGKELFLFNESDQSLVNMREQGTYSFKSQKGNRFRIFFGENLAEQIKPTKVLAGDPYPNPSNGMTIIPFTLGDNQEKYNVQLDIVDILGRPVGRVLEGTFQPGFHKAAWDASDHNTTNGFYVFRLVVESNGVREIHAGKIAIHK